MIRITARWRATAWLALCLVVAWHGACAANVILIQKSSAQNPARLQLEKAAGFYGLSIAISVADLAHEDAAANQSLRSPELLAVVVNADALGFVNEKKLLACLQRNDGRQIPLLIAGINAKTDFEALRRWSSGEITGSQRSIAMRTNGWYAVGTQNDVTAQLGGNRLPLLADDASYLKLSKDAPAERLLEVKSATAEFTVFVRTAVDNRKLFFAAETPTVEIPTTPDPYRQQAVFASLAPSMLFLRYAAGEHAWHSEAEYANFTIDDLWLREPYGHVNYEDLLRHSKQHDFHTTIAFIPWNFDRSQPKMVALFREHPDRLSICVHGNDHVHQEFGPLDSHPLQGQVEDMRQGLARMERFRASTQVPYDAVMVFPHSIAPEATFAELRRSHYLATANSLNVPSDAQTPDGAEFALRTATLQFGDFPSLRRYSVETDIPHAQLAIDAFLGNPMLFYAHESFFATGIDAFDNTADFVNKLQPGTKWRSLGEIARHLYLERLRDDGNYALHALSATIQIENTHERDAVFFVEKEEDFSQPLTVQVDGAPYSFKRDGAMLRLSLPIQAGRVKTLNILYENNASPTNIDIAKHSWRTNAIRLLSDFRDNVVSNTEVGRRFIRSYADHGRSWNLAMMGVAVLLAMRTAVWITRRRRKAHSGGARILPASQVG